ncbi:MAG: PadR family transcriptional regulator [Acidimicrobiales bacterium]
MLKFLILGLLAGQPRYGYDLKPVFEEFLGGTWTLNIGQVYTTLGRLEAEGLVACERVVQDSAPDRKVYSLTTAGEAALRRWADDPTEGPIRLRDDFFVKVLIRSRLGDGDTRAIVAGQRRRHMVAMATLTRLRDAPDVDPRTALLLDGAILRAEADLKWLDICEDRLKELT